MFANDISYAFLYDRKDTFLYKLDPRIKLFYVVITTLAVFFARDPIVAATILLLQVIVASLGGLLRKIASLVKGLIPFLLIIMVFNTILVYLTSFTIDFDALTYTFYMMIVRVFTALVAFTILMSTTSPQEIMQALVKMKISYVYAYPLVITFRFIPIIFTEMKNIYDAQRSRGLELEKGNIIEKSRKLIPIIIPSIVCALFRAKDLAEAMESRSFGALPKRTFYKQLRIKKLDILFLASTSLAEIACFILASLPFLGF